MPYSDTDSSVDNIKHPDNYEWINGHKQHFDLSDYTRAASQSNEHKKTLGWFKDELHGRVMSEMLGLTPKPYAFKKQHIEKNKDIIKPIEDIIITFKINRLK